MANGDKYTLIIPDEFESILIKLKKNKPDILRQLQKQITKILSEPILGKPLRNALRNYRRMHAGSYVLIYEISLQEVRLLDFDHHDKIYKKYKYYI